MHVTMTALCKGDTGVGRGKGIVEFRYGTMTALCGSSLSRCTALIIASVGRRPEMAESVCLMYTSCFSLCKRVPSDEHR